MVKTSYFPLKIPLFPPVFGQTAHSRKFWFDIYHFIQIERQTTLQENFVYEK